LFLSSTFRDMQAEREELLKRILPRVRKLCAQRGVNWNEVDLRWGITEEQAERGDVLPVCLAEIDRCRPFFLCLLGERYGWIPGPDRIPAELRTRYPRLNEHLDDSVTEMECGTPSSTSPASRPTPSSISVTPPISTACPRESDAMITPARTTPAVGSWRR
jgi:hypothetical protein